MKRQVVLGIVAISVVAALFGAFQVIKQKKASDSASNLWLYLRVKNDRSGKEGDADNSKTAIRAKKGDHLTFTAIVVNKGTKPVRNVVISYVVPNGLEFAKTKKKRSASGEIKIVPANQHKFILIKTRVVGKEKMTIESSTGLSLQDGSRIDSDSAFIKVSGGKL